MPSQAAPAPSKAGSTAISVQLALEVSESSSHVQVILSPVAEAAADDVKLTSQQSSHAEAAAGAAEGAAAEPLGDESAHASSNQAQSQQSADSASDTPKALPLLGSGEENPSLAELERLLMEEKKNTAALTGKTLLFGRVMLALALMSFFIVLLGYHMSVT